jgi:hypothetical protein
MRWETPKGVGWEDGPHGWGKKQQFPFQGEEGSSIWLRVRVTEGAWEEGIGTEEAKGPGQEWQGQEAAGLGAEVLDQWQEMTLRQVRIGGRQVPTTFWPPWTWREPQGPPHQSVLYVWDKGDKAARTLGGEV